MGVVLLVRHGQASFGADDYDVLSPTGWEQARQLGAWLRDRGVEATALVQGGMRRHRETAAALADAAGWDLPVSTDPGWDEFDHLAVLAADSEASSPPVTDRRAFQRAFEQATARWTTGAHDADYAETWSGFRDRCAGALARACDASGAGRVVVVVTSGGPIAAACATLVDPEAEPAAFARTWSRLNTVLVNTALSRVVVGSSGARLLTFNEHPHLEGESLTYR